MEAARERQAAERAKLQDYVARNSARASTAKQAQSRAKALAKMQPIAAALEDPSLSFAFPDPPELRPPLITLDMAAVGYDERSEEHTSELQSLMRISYAVFCLKKKIKSDKHNNTNTETERNPIILHLLERRQDHLSIK